MEDRASAPLGISETSRRSGPTASRRFRGRPPRVSFHWLAGTIQIKPVRGQPDQRGRVRRPTDASTARSSQVAQAVGRTTAAISVNPAQGDRLVKAVDIVAAKQSSGRRPPSGRRHIHPAPPLHPRRHLAGAQRRAGRGRFPPSTRLRLLAKRRNTPACGHRERGAGFRLDADGLHLVFDFPNQRSISGAHVCPFRPGPKAQVKISSTVAATPAAPLGEDN